MLPFDEALAKLIASVRPLDSERVGIFEACERVLREDIVARRPLPGFDHSSMDGYAIRLADLRDAAELEVAGVSAAGDAPSDAPEGKVAVRVYTGAPIPRGMDAVVMQEDVAVSEREGKQYASFSVRPSAGAWIRRRGEDLAEGGVGLRTGQRLGPGHVALAAALDRASLVVARRPIVTVLGSGDELRSPGDPPRPNDVVESNGFFVAACARRAGAIARLAPFVRDDPADTERAVAAALRGTDVLVTIGGVSVGDRDYVRPALERAGVVIDFYKVAMKPGKPLTVGRAAQGGALVLGLPGNPASASLAFSLFGVPVLRALQADHKVLPLRTRMRVEGTLERKPGRTEFARATLERDERGAFARILPNQASGAATSFAEADALAILAAERGRYTGGEELEVIRLTDL